MATVAAPESVKHLVGLETPEILKVSSSSRPTAVAGAIAGIIRHNGHTELQAVGAGAVNQATKAIAIARHYLAPEGIDIVCIPDFAIVTIADQDKTAVRLIVEVR
jgi:stage V sporulation protein S